MSFVTTQPEMLSTAAGDLASAGIERSERRSSRPDRRGGCPRRRRGVGGDGDAVRDARPDVSGGQRPGPAIHDQFVAMLGVQRGVVCGHRGRQRIGSPLMSIAMDFSVLPPEINSARMYSGPGCGAVDGRGDGLG